MLQANVRRIVDGETWMEGVRFECQELERIFEGEGYSFIDGIIQVGAANGTACDDVPEREGLPVDVPEQDERPWL